MPRYLARSMRSTLIAVALLGSTLAHAWTIVDLGVELSFQSIDQLSPYETPPGLNSLGHVAGSVDTPDGTRAFVWSNEAGLRILGVLPAAEHSWAIGINDSGQIVGSDMTT